MRAVIYKEFSSPDQLTVGEIETPEPKPNEVLVSIKANGLAR